MRNIRYHVVAAALCASLSPAYAGWLWDRDGLDAFVQPQTYIDAALSPDGRHLAKITYDDRLVAHIVVDDLDDGSERLYRRINRARPDDSTAHGLRIEANEPRTVVWISDSEVVITFTNSESGLVNVAGSEIPSAFDGALLGFARVDGETKRSMVVHQSGPHGFDLVAVTPTTPRWIRKPFAIADDVSEPLSDWINDETGLVRIRRTLRDTPGSHVPIPVTSYRRAEGAPWVTIDSGSSGIGDFRPIAVTKDPSRIIVQSRNGGDRLAMWYFDVEERKFLGIAAAEPDADVVGGDAAASGDGLEDAVAIGLKPRTIWFDDRMQRAQAAVDAALPDHVNQLQPGRSRRLLVKSKSDVDPGGLYIFDTENSSLKKIATLRPNIDPAKMRPMQTLHYPSFDGLQIPAYLTLPSIQSKRNALGKPLPTIMLIHGGPWVRDQWEWNRDAQVFASHGYAVFQPQFRGSTGFGAALQAGGYHQWGRAMQDDITAGVRYLVDQKIADPARICIVGTSYGGYAALWGLEKTPELYKCGVSTAGISDLVGLMRGDSDVNRSESEHEIMLRLIGDPDVMEQAMNSVSPLNHADRIQAPLLLVHGRLDERVPISQGESMRDAMLALNKDVTWIEFAHEPHGVYQPEDLRAWYGAMFRLFERTIGKGDAPP